MLLWKGKLAPNTSMIYDQATDELTGSACVCSGCSAAPQPSATRRQSPVEPVEPRWAPVVKRRGLGTETDDPQRPFKHLPRPAGTGSIGFTSYVFVALFSSLTALIFWRLLTRLLLPIVTDWIHWHVFCLFGSGNTWIVPLALQSSAVSFFPPAAPEGGRAAADRNYSYHWRISPICGRKTLKSSFRVSQRLHPYTLEQKTI